MTIEELVEELLNYPQRYTVMADGSETEVIRIECGHDFVGCRDTIILIGE